MSRKYGVPVYAQWLEPAAGGTAVVIRQKSLQREKSHLVVQRSKRTIIATGSGAGDGPHSAGADAGDVWIDRGTGSVLFVKSRDPSNGRIDLELQNNWKGNPGEEVLVQPLDFATGQFQCIPTRLYTPDYPLLIDSRAGSPILENAGTANGSVGALASGSPAAGDRFAVDNDEDNMIDSGAVILSVDPLRRALRTSVKANESHFRKRLGVFRAAPPENVTGS